VKFWLSQLVLLLAVTTVATAVAGLVATYRTADQELRDVLDEDLESQGRMLARLLASGRIDMPRTELASLLTRAFKPDEEETLWVSVYDLSTSELASNLPHHLELKSLDSGTVSLQWDGHDWHGYQRREAGLVIQLLRRADLYADVQGDIIEDIMVPVVAGTSINLLLLGVFLGMLLWPLSRLVRQLESRSAESLEPLTVRTQVAEISVLRDTLNRLMEGVDSVLRRERQFSNDVAHELRTPLTTLKLELAGPDPDLAMLGAEVNRIARVVEQLLTLARIEEGHWRASFAPIQFAGFWAAEGPRIASKIAAAQMELETDIQAATIVGDAVLIEVLIQNLVRNVIQHCPPHTQIHISMASVSGQPVLAVSDNGPGIPPDQLERLNVGGFTRLDSKHEGLGLGLAICHRIAQVHGASLCFAANPGGAPGLRVEIRFPP
jgi:signal transduction histidine kinase